MPRFPIIWIIVEQGPVALAIGAGGGCLETFFLSSIVFLFFLPLRETTRYRLKYCLKRPLKLEKTNKSISGTLFSNSLRMSPMISKDQQIFNLHYDDVWLALPIRCSWYGLLLSLFVGFLLAYHFFVLY